MFTGSIVPSVTLLMRLSERFPIKPKVQQDEKIHDEKATAETQRAELCRASSRSHLKDSKDSKKLKG